LFLSGHGSAFGLWVLILFSAASISCARHKKSRTLPPSLLRKSFGGRGGKLGHLPSSEGRSRVYALSVSIFIHRFPRMFHRGDGGFRIAGRLKVRSSCTIVWSTLFRCEVFVHARGPPKFSAGGVQTVYSSNGFTCEKFA
jgi:hypothetical protein